MSIATLSCLPSSFEAGTTLIFNHADSSFPVDDDWTAFLILAKPGQAPKRIDATVDGTKFLFTIPKIVSAGWLAGYYDYAFYFEKDGERGTGTRGKIAILDNLAIAQPKTDAEEMVDTLKKAVKLLGATTDASVSFNGQSFTQVSIGTYRADLVYWEARVIRERDELARLRGTEANGFFAVNFK